MMQALRRSSRHVRATRLCAQDLRSFSVSSRRHAAVPMNEKSEGTIASVFASLSNEEAVALPQRFAALKQSLLADEATRAAVVESWHDLVGQLRDYNAEIKRRQQDVSTPAPPRRSSTNHVVLAQIIPQIAFKDFVSNANDTELAAEVKERGVVVIKGVVPAETALGWKESIKAFCRDNPAVKGTC